MTGDLEHDLEHPGDPIAGAIRQMVEAAADVAEAIDDQRTARALLAATIRTARAAGATMQQLADALGIKRQNVYRLAFYERNDHR